MKWKQIIANGFEPVPRHGHRAVATKDVIFIYGGGDLKICKSFHGYKVKENYNYLPKFNGRMPLGVASFGMEIFEERIILIFGGMMEYGHYTNDLHTLNLNTMTFKKFCTQSIPQAPSPRFGHSFTKTDDRRIFIFGGVINAAKNPRKENLIRYMNDLYVLHIIADEKFRWERLPRTANDPPKRESHSAVFYFDEKENRKFLIIFGGMNGARLGDLWFLDLRQLIWKQFEIEGIPPSPRSLHTANLIGQKMYVFGGWVEQQPPRSIHEEPFERFKTTNSLSYLDLERMEWTNCIDDNEICPSPRAGHVAVPFGSRMYLWGGRSSYRHDGTDSGCAKDFYFLETELPQAVTKISLVRATMSTLEIKWDDIPNADCYLIEIHKVQVAHVDFSKIRILTGGIVKKEDQNETGIKRKAEDQNTTTPEKKKLEEPKKEQTNDENNNIKTEAQKVDVKIETKPEVKIVKVEAKPEKTVIKIDMPKLKIMNLGQSKNLTRRENSWLTVGIFRTNSCIVDGFYTFNADMKTLNVRNCPQPTDFKPELKSKLCKDTSYAFRIASVNSMGCSEWSKLVHFKTNSIEHPTAPNNCKFIGTTQGLRLAWNPNPLSEKITSYTVQLVTKKDIKDEYCFSKVYEGIQPCCNVTKVALVSAYRQKIVKQEYILFKIVANNSAGSSPPLMATHYI